MRLSIAINAYDAAWIIKEVIGSIRNIADEIIVVEGSWSAELPNRSADGTYDIIYDIAKEMPKMKLYRFDHNDWDVSGYHGNTYHTQISYVTAMQHFARQFAVDRCDLHSDYILFVDSDEVWEEESIKEMISFMENNLQVGGMASDLFTFYFNGDWYHRETSTVRLFRNTGNLLNTGGMIFSFEGDRSVYTNKPYFHYGWVNPVRIASKQKMWANEVRGWEDRVLSMFDGSPESIELINSKGPHLLAHIAEAFKGVKLNRWNGNHPSIMQNHQILKEK
jgi:glycosyltransferase involved in cell wall biosynthesis